MSGQRPAAAGKARQGSPSIPARPVTAKQTAGARVPVQNGDLAWEAGSDPARTAAGPLVGPAVFFEG